MRKTIHIHMCEMCHGNEARKWAKIRKGSGIKVPLCKSCFKEHKVIEK